MGLRPFAFHRPPSAATLASMGTPTPEIMSSVRQLVDEYRDRCLWFLRPDYYPADREEVLRTLTYIERHGDRDGYQRAAEIRRWLSPHSSAASAGLLAQTRIASGASRDSAFRFFPLVEHLDLGLVLHPFDLATNKVLALVGRLEPRDWIDVIECDDRLQPLGYLAWAASGKDPGFTPTGILDGAARSGR